MSIHDLWALYKNDSLGENGDNITSKYRCFDIDTPLLFMMGRLMCKKN